MHVYLSFRQISVSEIREGHLVLLYQIYFLKRVQYFSEIQHCFGYHYTVHRNRVVQGPQATQISKQAIAERIGHGNALGSDYVSRKQIEYTICSKIE